MTGSNFSPWRSRSSTICPPARKTSTTRVCSAETKLVSSGCAKTTRTRKLRSGWLHASIPSLICAVSRYEKFDARGGDQHLPDVVLEHPIGVGDPLAKMLELEPGFDQIGFLVAAKIARVFKYSPGERAVTATLESELVQSSHERGAVFGIDPVLDLDQDRAAIVVDLLTGFRERPMLGGRQVQRALLQFPSPGERNCNDCACRSDEQRGRESGPRGDLTPGRAAQSHRSIDDGQKHGEPASAHPIWQDILRGGVKAGEGIDPRHAGQETSAQRNREVLGHGEQRHRGGAENCAGGEQPIGAELTAQFLMSE